MNSIESNVIVDSLMSRQRKIQIAKDYLARTQGLFNEFGSSELKTSHARFSELENALDSTQVRLVVLGEFSRGKSALLNVLLGIKLLPESLRCCTAINTFLLPLPPNRTERFIIIHFMNGRPSEEIAWSDDSVLIRWGTELEKDNADARLMIDYIEVFFDHPLLHKDLVLIDTPGLQTIVKHHEQITRRAIAEAHIALWVQSADMLGGSATERKLSM
jgi:GTPase SAR1 family protein